MNLKRLMRVKDGFDYGINNIKIKIGEVISGNNVGSFLVTRRFKSGEVMTIEKFLGIVENLKRQSKQDVGSIYILDDFSEQVIVYFDSVYDLELANVEIIPLDNIANYHTFNTSLSRALSDICEKYRK